MTDLSVGEAAVARDALCRTLYSRLFTWIVARINDAVKVSTQMSSQPIFCNRNPTYGVEVFLKSPAKLYIYILEFEMSVHRKSTTNNNKVVKKAYIFHVPPVMQ